MNATRRLPAVLFFLGAVVLVVPKSASGDRIDGGVTLIVTNARFALFSNEVCQAYYPNGQPAFLDHVTTNHGILADAGGTLAHVLVTANFQTSSNLTANGAADNCYTAAADVFVSDGTFGGFRAWHCFDPPPPPPDNCPIVLDLSLNGLHLSGANPPVSFDINADGTLNQIAWTAANSDDALLCLDRNGNGRIDDGSELFGYATPLANGQPAQVGFRALAEYDTPALGGNGDDIIDARDAVFAKLCVWRDTNRNGVSDADEITPLSNTNVLSISTRYITTNISDGYGNQFRYVGWTSVRRPGSTTSIAWPAYDVVFASAPQ